MSKRSVGRGTQFEEALVEDLRREARRSIPDSTDLWPELREKASRCPKRRMPRSRQAEHGALLRTRARFSAVFAIMILALVGGGAYAAAGLLGILDGTYDRTVPYVYEHGLGTAVRAEESRGGVTITVDRVYADSAYVAVAYSVEGLRELGNPTDLTTDLELLEPRSGRGGAGGREYGLADGFWHQLVTSAGGDTDSRGSEAGTVVFEASEELEAGETHRFRAEVEITGPTGPVPNVGAFETERVGEPFVLEFEVPVGEASTIAVNQTVEAASVPITLTEVVNSPAKTRAYLCFEPSEHEYDWPLVKTGLFERGRLAEAPVYHVEEGTLKDGCATYVFDETLYGDPGTHSLTITELHASDPKETHDPIEGPWRFTFEIPEPQVE